MTNEMIGIKAEAVGRILGICIVFGSLFLVVTIFDINPEKEYGWFMGNLHGVWSLHNWILSCFNGDILVKAPLHTSAYNIWWWIGLVLSVYTWIEFLLSIIINIRIIKNAK